MAISGSSTGGRGFARALSLLAVSFAFVPEASGQELSASVRVERMEIKTYPYSDPDPVPMLVRDARLYPYHAFDGLTDEAEMREWDVVVLENDFIQVFVLPEVGGKVWGAIDKSSGEEFIYRNEVMKFRNIALRGPWTSGGIEFNFGVIGHAPSTASPVDYALVKNSDGSVSCFVGTMDLPSRTQWRVEIRLPADKAYFETRTTWYNPTSVEQPYYNWMTAAASAADDLVMSAPGDTYLRHSGEAMSWPVDSEDRDLSIYRNNAFGGSKSYHVVGEYNDFFGGYYTDQGFGFGHWSRYQDMPGQKIWLWALSRQGGIWEDLLTDGDGQYIEFQAGRLLVQYSPGEHKNPITQAGFEPHRTDRWTERWFPVVGIGGLSDASADGAMHVRLDGGQLRIGVNPFGFGEAELIVRQGDELVHQEELSLEPMAVLTAEVAINQDEPFEVLVRGLDLRYVSESAPADTAEDTPGDIARPFSSRSDAGLQGADEEFFAGRELMKARRYREARNRIDAALEEEPAHLGALLATAELDFRSGRYGEGLKAANTVRTIDAYHPQANYLAGILHRALGTPVDRATARDAFAWASRATQFRAAANVELAEMALAGANYGEAESLALDALDFDRHNVGALEILVIASRGLADSDKQERWLNRLRAVDRLNALLRFEGDGLERTGPAFRSEFPDQTFVELALSYHRRGQTANAVRLLSEAIVQTDSQLARIWLAFLTRDPAALGEADVAPLDEARPYRRETLEALRWAVSQNDHWRWRYLLALNLWAVDRAEEAATLMAELGDSPDETPDAAAAYIARAALLAEVRGDDREADLQRALLVDDADRRTWLHLLWYYETAGRWDEALAVSAPMMQRFGDDFVVRLGRARALLHSGDARGSLDVLAETKVLPAEGAGDARELYSLANTQLAIDLIEANDLETAGTHLQAAMGWPEHLGRGKPYAPDESLQRYLLAYTEWKSDGEDLTPAYAERREALQREVDNLASAPPSSSSALRLRALRRALELPVD